MTLKTIRATIGSFVYEFDSNLLCTAFVETKQPFTAKSKMICFNWVEENHNTFNIFEDMEDMRALRMYRMSFFACGYVVKEVSLFGAGENNINQPWRVNTQLKTLCGHLKALEVRSKWTIKVFRVWTTTKEEYQTKPDWKGNLYW